MSKDECFRQLLSRVELLVDDLFIDEPFIEDLSTDECLWELLFRVDSLVDNLSIDELFNEDLSTDEGFSDLLSRASLRIVFRGPTVLKQKGTLLVIQLNLYQTELLFQYVFHDLT